MNKVRLKVTSKTPCTNIFGTIRTIPPNQTSYTGCPKKLSVIKHIKGHFFGTPGRPKIWGYMVPIHIDKVKKHLAYIIRETYMFMPFSSCQENTKGLIYSSLVSFQQDSVVILNCNISLHAHHQKE